MQVGKLAVRWTPANATDTLTIRELNTFGALSLNDSEVGLRPEVVAEFSGGDGKDAKAIAEGPLDPKDSKGPILPIAQGPNAYLPGALGFPPNVDTRDLPKIPPPSIPASP